MKKTVFLALFALVALTLSSCQKIKDSLTVDVPVTFDVELDVTTGSDLKSNPGAFSSSKTFDPAGDEDLAQYLSKIQGYELTGMTGVVSGLSESLTIESATLTVTNGSKTASWTVTNLPISDGTALSLTNDGGQWTTIGEMMGELKTITVTFAGVSDKPNVVYTLICTFEALVKAGIL